MPPAPGKPAHPGISEEQAMRIDSSRPVDTFAAGGVGLLSILLIYGVAAALFLSGHTIAFQVYVAGCGLALAIGFCVTNHYGWAVMSLIAVCWFIIERHAVVSFLLGLYT
jgi:hypothetical protein